MNKFLFSYYLSSVEQFLCVLRRYFISVDNLYHLGSNISTDGFKITLVDNIR